MSETVLFSAQIATFILFVITLFVLYRTLVSQKDATIQLLKEKNSLLSEKLKWASENNPDKLAESLSSRVKLLGEEIERLSDDKNENQNLIKEKELELEEAQNNISEFKKIIEKAQEFATGLYCPYCKSIIHKKDYFTKFYEYEGKDYDIDHEYIEYECGYSTIDGSLSTPCKKKTT